MIYCEICTNTFAGEDFADCPHCALAEGRAATPAVHALDTPAPGVTMGDVIDTLRRMTPPQNPPEPLAAEPQPPEGMSESLRALVEQKVDQAVAASSEPPTFAPPTFTPTSSEAEPAADGPIIGQTARELDIETLRRIRESGVFTMVLLGFPTAGKTWFLNRLKYELQEGDAYACYPRRAPPGDVENTVLFTAHRFRKGAQDFYVIDIPGERFLRAVEGSFLGEANTLMRHVIYTGQAFLTLLPADETLFSELAHDVLWRRAAAGGTAPVDLTSLPPAQALIDRVDALKRMILQARKAADAGDGKAQAKLKALVRERKQLLDGGVEQALHRLAAKHEELGEYVSGVGLMAQLMVVMEERGGPDLDSSIDAYAVFDRSRDAERKKPTKPMFIVLSKSDNLTQRSDAVQLPIRRLLQGHPQAAHLLRILRREPRKADAFAILNALRPGVARQIDEWFAFASFQFATAFEGVARGSTTINYRLGHVGVTDLIRALLRLKDHTDKPRAWDSVAGLFPAASSGRSLALGAGALNRHGGAGPLIASGVLVFLVLIGLVWSLGLEPSLGTATVGAAPTRGGGPWIERLGLSQLEPWSSPTPAFADRLAALGDTAQGAALKRDLCQGGGMDADPAFREARRALVRNEADLCAAPIEHVAAVSPVIVALGPRLGWPCLMAMSIAALGLGLWRLVALKRTHDRWRLLGRSTFGAARRAGSG